MVIWKDGRLWELDACERCSHREVQLYNKDAFAVFVWYIWLFQHDFSDVGFSFAVVLSKYINWLERCSGIAWSWVPIPFKPEFFSGSSFSTS